MTSTAAVDRDRATQFPRFSSALGRPAWRELEEPLPVSGQAVHIVYPEHVAEKALREICREAGFSVRVHHGLPALQEAAGQGLSGCLVLDSELGLDGDVLAHPLPILPVPVVLTSRQSSVPLAVCAIKAGAFDFLEQPLEKQRLLEAVSGALAANRAAQAADAEQDELRRRFETLSCREREVVALVTEGKMNKQAAWELGLSEITVKVHRGAAMRKMGARSLADLVRMVEALARTGDPRRFGFRDQRLP